MNDAGHSEHWNGFSPVWDKECCCKFLKLANDDSQRSHRNLSPGFDGSFRFEDFTEGQVPFSLMPVSFKWRVCPLFSTSVILLFSFEVEVLMKAMKIRRFEVAKMSELRLSATSVFDEMK